MTIKQLVEMCENCEDCTSVMVYESVEAFDHDLCNWRTLTMEQAELCNAAVAKFGVYHNFVAVALA